MAVRPVTKRMRKKGDLHMDMILFWHFWAAAIGSTPCELDELDLIDSPRGGADAETYFQ